jgi:hypothetical protein
MTSEKSCSTVSAYPPQSRQPAIRVPCEPAYEWLLAGWPLATQQPKDAAPYARRRCRCSATPQEAEGLQEAEGPAVTSDQATAAVHVVATTGDPTSTWGSCIPVRGERGGGAAQGRAVRAGACVLAHLWLARRRAGLWQLSCALSVLKNFCEGIFGTCPYI